MDRIQLTDNIMDVMVKMSDGNPGAIQALMDIHENGAAIDPQGFLGGLGAIMILDTWDIYGTDIYILWNDKCNKDVRKMLMIMRACQLGFLSHVKLQQMAADQMREVNLTDEEWSDFDEQVCGRLPEFQRAA